MSDNTVEKKPFDGPYPPDKCEPYLGWRIASVVSSSLEFGLLNLQIHRQNKHMGIRNVATSEELICVGHEHISDMLVDLSKDTNYFLVHTSYPELDYEEHGPNYWGVVIDYIKVIGYNPGPSRWDHAHPEYGFLRRWFYDLTHKKP